MFTGIVEELGSVKRISRGARSVKLEIAATKVIEDAHVGDSICTQGVCLTVTELGSGSFAADVMHETLSRSSLGSLAVGDPVNLERAMPVGGRLGGHIVSGHIDGTGRIVRVKNDGNAVWYTVSAGPELMRYIVEKGSIAIDGISLTVARVSDASFAVSTIPHTGEMTTLSARREGDVVNLECDIIAKYVEKLMRPREPAGESPGGTSGITMELLAENGF